MKTDEDDYEVPIPYGGKKKTGKHDDEEVSTDSSDSDFMDVSQMKPARPDTIPVKLDDKTATMFVAPPPAYHDFVSRSQRFEKRRMTDGSDPARINDSVNLRRAVSFASCEMNAVRNKRANWAQKNNNYQHRPAAPVSRGHSFLSVPQQGQPLNRASSTNSVAYVVSVQEAPKLNYPPFVTPSNKARGLGKSRTFTEADKRKVAKKDLVQIRSVSQHSSMTRANYVPRANLRDSAIDLVSDEEDSEAYAAVSLAGTLSRNGPKINSPKRWRKKRLLLIILVLSVFVVILVVTLVTVLVLTLK